MLNKLRTDLQTRGNFVPLSEEVHAAKLGYYYILFGTDISKLNKLIREYDEQGIPLNAAYIDVEEGKSHYYPISIGQVGLSIFHQYLDTGSRENRAHFLRIADWFMQNRTENPELGTFWLTEIPKPEYKVTDPWKSAFTQSRAISILLRAWQKTGDDRYLQTATSALRVFTIDISEGGVAVRRPNAEIFYEEYVAAYPTRVLDGHFFSLFGLYDYIRAVPAELSPESHALASALFNDGVQGLIEALPKYDLGYWVLFNRCEVPGYPEFDPCTINYLQLVVQQLEVLSKITNESIFDGYKEKFKTYLSWSNILRMYRAKFKALKNLNRI